MKLSSLARMLLQQSLFVMMAFVALVSSATAQQVTFAPYLQLGDNGKFGSADQIVIAWQTDESMPNPSAYKVEFHSRERDSGVVKPSGRVVDNYLVADPMLPAIPGAYGTHTNYIAVLKNLRYDTVYQYRVSGPGMPNSGFNSSFRTRTRGSEFAFAVEGDEGFFPVVPNSDPARIVDYAARIAHLIYDADQIQLSNGPSLPEPEFVVNTGDNVYTEGTEDNYRDFFFPVFNSDQDSNEAGAPILRSKLFLQVDGNHDVGSTGVGKSAGG